MKFEHGDSVKFGKKWCKENRNNDLIGKTVMMTPQWFEEDNGLYCYESECPGMWDEKNEEADSIYHLFGNEFEWFMDCELIKGSPADKDAYEKIRQERINKEAEYWNNLK